MIAEEAKSQHSFEGDEIEEPAAKAACGGPASLGDIVETLCQGPCDGRRGVFVGSDFKSGFAQVMEIIGGLPEQHGAVEGGCSSIEPGNGSEESFVHGGDVAEAEGSAGSQDARAFSQEGGFVGVVQGGFEVEKEIDGVIAERDALGVSLDEGDGGIGSIAGASDAVGEKFDADDARGGEFLCDPSRGAADPAADIEDGCVVWDGCVAEESPDEFALKIGERAGSV